MSLFPNKNQTSRLADLAKGAALIAALAILPACASISSNFRQSDSTLPIQVTDSTGGLIASTRAFETSDRLYVAGNMHRSIWRKITASAHVDVELISGNGQVIASKQDDIDEKTRSRYVQRWNRRYAYVASFPLEIARSAVSIRVTYDLNPHPGDTFDRAQL